MHVKNTLQCEEPAGFVKEPTKNWWFFGAFIFLKTVIIFQNWFFEYFENRRVSKWV
jgi:hypothetical protein